MNPAAIVLCGGRSRRMGRSKADLPFGRETMLHRVVRLVSQSAHPVVVAASADQRLPLLPHDVIIARDDRSHRGPLHGLAAGLAALPPSSGLVYLASVDSPFIVEAWLRLLRDRIDGEHDAAAPSIEDRLHPFGALYRVDPAREAVAQLLAVDDRRLSMVPARLRTNSIDEQELRRVDPSLLSLVNVNTPGDYERALRLMDAAETKEPPKSH